MAGGSAGAWRLACLASLSLPLAMLGLPLVVTIPEYYSNALGMDLAAVGVIVMAGRIFDIALDPILGVLMDRTRSRWGRYKPWLAIGAPLLIVSTAMLFFATPGVGLVHLGVWLFLVYLGWSVLSLVQLALAAGMSPGGADRAKIYGWLQATFFLGIALVLLFPLLLGKEKANDAATSIQAMGMLIIAAAVAGSLLVAALVPGGGGHVEGVHGGSREMWAVVKRKSVFRLVAADLLFGLGFGLASTLMIFFFTTIKGVDRGAIGMLLVGQMFAGIAATPLNTALARWLGKRGALVVCGVAAALVCPALLLLPEGQVAPAMVVMAAWGVPYGGVTLLPRAMMADAADEVKLHSGADRTGMLFALLVSSWKMGAALAIGVSFTALDLIGYKPMLGAGNAPEALAGLQWLFGGIPAILFVCGTAMAWSYPLTETVHAEISGMLKARSPATEPSPAE